MNTSDHIQVVLTVTPMLGQKSPPQQEERVDDDANFSNTSGTPSYRSLSKQKSTSQ